jgi:hypothetical protein
MGGAQTNAQPSGVISVSVESIEEFRVATANQTSDFANSSGSQVQMVTKRGTNNYHGAAYLWYFDTVIGSANNWTANHTPSNIGGVLPTARYLSSVAVTEAAQSVFSGDGVPPLEGVRDEFSMESPNYTWTVTLPLTVIGERLRRVVEAHRAVGLAADELAHLRVFRFVELPRRSLGDHLALRRHQIGVVADLEALLNVVRDQDRGRAGGARR